MNRECRNCKNCVTDYDATKKRFISRCNKYPAFAVYGSIAGTMNPDCTEFTPIREVQYKTLAEKTFEMAGGAYNRRTEQARSGIKELTPWRPLKWNRPCR